MSEVKVWPPLTWDEFFPKTYKEIQEHYFSNTPGCAWAYTQWAIQAVIWIGAAVVSIVTVGIGTPAAAAGAAAASSGAAAASEAIKEAIKANIKKSIEDRAKAELNNATKKARKDGVSGAEMDRIRDSYVVSNRLYGAWRRSFATKSLAELKLIMVGLEDKLQNLHLKACESCGKDGGMITYKGKQYSRSVACRDTGFHVLTMQYCQLLISTYEGSGTTNPAQYNAYVESRVQQIISSNGGMLEGSVSSTKVQRDPVMASIGWGAGILLVGVLVSMLVKGKSIIPNS